MTLNDRQSTSANTLKVSAKNVGAWANTMLAIEIVDSSTDRFGLKIYGSAIGVAADTRSNLLESYTDLSMDTNDPRYVVDYVNSFSNWVALTDLNSAASTVALKRPAVTGTTLSSLSGGADTTSTYIGRTDYSTATSLLDGITTPLLLNNPDAAYVYSSAGSSISSLSSADARTLALNIMADLVKYAETAGNGFAVLDTPSGLSSDDAITFAAAVKTATGGAYGAQAAMYFPWISIPDPLKNINGVLKNMPPAPAVMGQYQETDSARGVFRSPAGYQTRLKTAVNLERRLTNTELDNLNTASVPINAPRRVPAGGGFVIMGGRTMLNEPGKRYVNVRRSMTYLKKELTDRSNFAVFENNDSRLWVRVSSVLSSFLYSYWQQGGLKGSTPSEAFFVKCDATNNTAQGIENGVINIQVGVALEYPAEFVLITIGQISGTASAYNG